MTKKLSALRTIEPTPETLSRMKATLDARVVKVSAVEKKEYRKQDFLVSPYVQRVLYGMSFFLFLLAFHINNPYVLKHALTSTVMMQAPHAHSKSLATLHELKDITSNEYLFANHHDYTAVKKSIELNKETLNTLSLQGEESLYSMEECLSDYTLYFHLLKKLEAKVEEAQKKKEVNHEALAALKEQVHEALEEAEDRLGSYPEDMED